MGANSKKPENLLISWGKEHFKTLSVCPWICVNLHCLWRVYDIRCGLTSSSLGTPCFWYRALCQTNCLVHPLPKFLTCFHIFNQQQRLDNCICSLGIHQAVRHQTQLRKMHHVLQRALQVRPNAHKESTVLVPWSPEKKSALLWSRLQLNQW